jgi:hypothetical protein
MTSWAGTMTAGLRTWSAWTLLGPSTRVAQRLGDMSLSRSQVSETSTRAAEHPQTINDTPAIPPC